MGVFRKKLTTDELAAKGNDLFDKGKYPQAIEVWNEGLNSLDAPLNAQSEAVWFRTAIADALFVQGEFEKACPYLVDAVSNLSGEGQTNLFVLLRLGQCSYELGKQQEAAEYLLRAYMLAGEDIFECEDEKYLSFIGDMIK